MKFLSLVNEHAKTLPKGMPPITVGHPSYGFIGQCVPQKGFMPFRNRWASASAIARDHSRAVVKTLRFAEDNFPKFLMAGLSALLLRDPHSLPFVLGAISTYDGIVTARGSGALQDVYMHMTASQTPITTSWYDMMNFASWMPMTAPTFTAYAHGGTGGAVMDATSNGSWLTNPGGTNKKYIVSMGVSVTSLTGFALAMLYDCLWAGEYVITSNTTINPTTDIAVTRYASTTPGDADFAGGNMMQCRLGSTLTHGGAPTITTFYLDQGGNAGSTVSIAPATGTLINRIVFNTTYNSATVIASTPFMPLTYSGDSGVTSLTQVVVSTGTSVTAGTIDHKIVRPLLIMPFIAAASYVEQDTTLNIGNMVELRNVSQVCGCLGWNLYSAGTTAANMFAFMRTVEG